MSKEDKFKYSISLLLVVFFGLLLFAFYIKNVLFLNVMLSIYSPLLLALLVFEIIKDIKQKSDKKSKKEYKYIFLALHSLLIYSFFTKTVNTVRPDFPFTLSGLLLFATFGYILMLLANVLYSVLKSLYLHKFSNPFNDNLVYLYAILAVVSTFVIFEIWGTGRDIDKLVYQDREKIINHYQELCSKQTCNEDEIIFYTKQSINNIFSQKYRVRIYKHENTDKKQCIVIHNTYFDPNIYINKCENEEIKVNYIGEKYNQ